VCCCKKGRPLDVTVAACDLAAGDVALSVPENLVVTLDRIFESEGLAEMLTAGKLSELAVLTLYMMYEKKVRVSAVCVRVCQRPTSLFSCRVIMLHPPDSPSLLPPLLRHQHHQPTNP
jgi:hypothetical protein